VDAIANVLFYVPLGLAIYLYVQRRTGRIAGGLVAIACSFTLSFTLEYLQFFQPGRIPSGSDLMMNTAGGGAGALAAGLWPRLGLKLRAPSGAEVILWPLWLTSLLFPFIPAIGLWIFRIKLRGMAEFDITTLTGASLQWLTAGVLLAKERQLPALAMLLLAPAQLFIAERQPTLGLAAGALAGSAIALTRLAPAGTALTGLLLLMLWGVAPFQLGPARPFSWIPFADAMESLRAGAVVVISAKCFAYGGTIVLLMRAGLRLPVATLLVVALLCMTEIAQTRIAGRTPASTDPVIAAVMALALAKFGLRP
jgi:hypothetical protein